MSNKVETANGFTKESIIAVIRNKFKGKSLIRDNLLPKEFWMCAYRGDNDKACAIGMFIPNGHLGLSKITGVTHLLEMFPDLWVKMPLEDSTALSIFQAVHDSLRESDSVQEQTDVLVRWVKENVA